MSRPEIASRLAFIAFDEEQRSGLARLKPQVQALIGRALDRFYSQARVTPATSAFFADEAHMRKAKAAQEAHWLRIADGKFDDVFFASVRRIGSVHARIGLEPRWYIGAYALVLEDLLRNVGRKRSLFGRLLSRLGLSDRQEASVALVKAALLDIDLSVSVYFEEAQADRNSAVEKLGAALGRLASGDVSETLSGLPESFAALEKNYNEAVVNLRDLIGAVMTSAETIRSGSGEIAHASEDLARRTERNAASLEETAASITEVDQRLRATATAAAQTVSRADGAIGTVSSGREIAGEAVQAMDRVAESAKGIDSVIEGLDKIAFQTRVLAMNAAVEAGRAGDAGRGFAVVADLVSALAMRAEEEAKRARSQIVATREDIGTAVDAVQRVDGVLSEISGDVGQVHALLERMATDNEAQARTIGEISTAVGSMDQTTQQNAAMVEETSAAAGNLVREVEALSNQAGRFTLGTRSAAQGAASPPPAYAAPFKPLPKAAVAALRRPSDDWNEF